MCGIVGIASPYSNGFSKQEVDAFQSLLFLDTMRGYDSTGIFGVDVNGNVGIHKAALHGLDFIQTKEFASFKTEMFSRGMFVVGHNRAATRGEISDKNAHPFWVDDKIVLVQNGTMRGDHKKHKDVDVDSEAVAHVISENASVEEALKSINAAYALVWYNVETKTLNLIRNSERPLFILQTDSGGLIWASEAAFIYMAADRAGITYKEQAQELAVHTHLQLVLEEKKWVRKEEVLDCSFRFPESTNYSFPHHFGGHVCEGEYSHKPWRGGSSNVLSLPSPATKTVLPDQVDMALSDVISQDYPEYFVTKELALAMAEEARTWDHEREKLVELIDYVPANSHKLCTTWHVFGRLHTPDNNSILDKIVIHWHVKDFTEAQIMRYVSEQWYSAKPSNVKFSTHNDTIHVVSVLMRAARQWATTNAAVH